MPASVGVLLSHPIQYFSPLYDLLTLRGGADLRVVYWNDAGHRPEWDPGFGRITKWDIDLVGGHQHEFLTRGPRIKFAGRLRAYRRIIQAVGENDVMIINGYGTFYTALAIVICQIRATPYLLRTDTSVLSSRSRWGLRYWWPRLVSRRSAGALAVGQRNEKVHEALGSPRLFSAPFAIDTDRFTETALAVLADRAAHRRAFGLPESGVVVAFAGKLVDGKRVDDLLLAVRSLQENVHTLVIGDGPLRARLELLARDMPVSFAGFLNQSEMPVALACADIFVLPSGAEAWGLVVNEAMACGCLPVVSDSVGCAPDLVEGIGEIYPTGDESALAGAIRRAAFMVGEAGLAQRIAERLAAFGLERCASGYELAIAEVTSI